MFSEHLHVNHFLSLELSYLIAVSSRLLLFQLLIFTFMPPIVLSSPLQGEEKGKGKRRVSEQ